MVWFDVSHSDLEIRSEKNLEASLTISKLKVRSMPSMREEM